MGDDRGKRIGILVCLMAVLVLSGIVYPTLVRAAGYSVSSESSCDTFLAAISASGSSTSEICFIESGTLGAGDTLTVGNFILRPQYSSNPDALVFTNQGGITLNNNPGDWSWYVAGKVDNQGTVDINGDSVNFHTINNSGTIVINASFSNYGTINNTGTIQKTCEGEFTNSGTFTGTAIEDLCLLTMTATSTATSTTTNTATNTPTNTATNTATSTVTDTPTNTPTSTVTDTPTTTPTSTVTDTATTTPTSTVTDTATNTPTNSPTSTVTNTATNTPTDTPTSTPTNTPTETPTATATPCVPAVPVLLAPADGGSVIGTQAHLDWQDDDCATKYKVRVKADAKNGRLVAKKNNLHVSALEVDVTLKRANIYFWRVKACNAHGCSKWTPWWSFYAAPKSSWLRDDWMFAKETQVALR